MGIELSHINAGIRRKQILHNVSLIARDGQVTGILGPNGCGKSTLVKTIFGIMERTSGDILLNGKNVKDLKKRAVARAVAYVGQETHVAFDFSVLDVARMPLYGMKGIDSQERAYQALGVVGMQEYADRSMLTLSGGEKKLVFVAGAIAKQTDIMILDEPTNHLDIKHQLMVLEYLRTSGKTVLMVIHDLNLASRYCDYVYLLKSGCNVAEGAPDVALSRANVHRVFEVKGEVTKDDRGRADFALDHLEGELRR